MLHRNSSILLLNCKSVMCPTVRATRVLDRRNVRTAIVGTHFTGPLSRRLVLPLTRRVNGIIAFRRNYLVNNFNSTMTRSVLSTRMPTSILQVNIPSVLISRTDPSRSGTTLKLAPPRVTRHVLDAFGIRGPILAI